MAKYLEFELESIYKVDIYTYLYMCIEKLLERNIQVY